MTRFLITPQEMLVLSKAEEIVGESASRWHGRCFEIASILADHMENAEAVYGHYLGMVDPKGYWGMSPGLIQHGWIIFKDSKHVMDPTRFSFENEKPYIYYGAALRDEYDEGGNGFRHTVSKPCPSFDHTNGIVEFKAATPDLARHLNCLLPSVRMERCIRIDEKQAFWLANVHYARLEPFAKEIYQALADHKKYFMAFVPTDNWERAFRTW